MFFCNVVYARLLNRNDWTLNCGWLIIFVFGAVRYLNYVVVILSDNHFCWFVNVIVFFCVNYVRGILIVLIYGVGFAGIGLVVNLMFYFFLYARFVWTFVYFYRKIFID